MVQLVYAVVNMLIHTRVSVLIEKKMVGGRIKLGRADKCCSSEMLPNLANPTGGIVARYPSIAHPIGLTRPHNYVCLSLLHLSVERLFIR